MTEFAPKAPDDIFDKPMTEAQRTLCNNKEGVARLLEKKEEFGSFYCAVIKRNVYIQKGSCTFTLCDFAL